MKPFERSWHTRKVCGRMILPHIRDQGSNCTCSYNGVAGAVESAYKKLYAERDQDFNKVISVDYLVSKFDHRAKIKEILSLIQREGARTEGDEFEVVQIEDFESLDPQDTTDQFVKLVTHVLSNGIALGVFLATSRYRDDTVYYQDVGVPILLEDVEEEDTEEFDDEVGKEEKDNEHYEADNKEEENAGYYHTVLLVSLGMDKDNNLFWRVLDSHSAEVGEGGFRRIAVNLIKEAYIIVPRA